MGLFKFIGQAARVVGGIATGNPAAIASGASGILRGIGSKGKKTVPRTAPTVGNVPATVPAVPMAATQTTAPPVPPKVKQYGRRLWGTVDRNPATPGLFDNPTQPGNWEEIAAALKAGGKTSKRGMFKMFLMNGSLDGIAYEPIRYTAPDGRVKLGSYSGYVLYHWMEGGQKNTVQIPKFIAQAFGIARRRRKPVISVRETQAIRRAKMAKRKAARVAKDAGLYVANSRPKMAKASTRRR